MLRRISSVQTSRSVGESTYVSISSVLKLKNGSASMLMSIIGVPK
ncbi:hypothetical protein ACFLQ2_02825 [archaeon]